MNFIKFNKRSMWKKTKFLVGDISFNTTKFSEKTLIYPKIFSSKKKEFAVNTLAIEKAKIQLSLINELYKEKKINEKNWVTTSENLQKEINALEMQNSSEKNDFSVLKKLLKPTKQTHGFSAMIVKDKILFTFHTSQNNSNIWGIKLENIPLNEPQNPIKNVIQTMDIKNFSLYYKISNPNNMLENLRYGDHTKHDLAYCGVRGLLKSINHSPQTLELKTKNLNNLETIIHNKFEAYEDAKILLPAQIIIKTNDTDQDLISKIADGFDGLNEKDKRDLLQSIYSTYEDFINVK